MALDVKPGAPNTPPTQAEIAAIKVGLQKDRIDASLRAFAESISIGRREFWLDPQVTPEQMAVAWGAECYELFAKNKATEDWLKAVYPGAAALIWQPPYELYDITPNPQAGTVVITRKPEPGPEESDEE